MPRRPEAHRARSFERELKNKLSQKSGGFTSEETVLMKAFKYFDLNNNGTVEPDEFAKAIEKIGIMIPTKQVGLSPVRVCAPIGRPPPSPEAPAQPVVGA